MRNKSTLLNVFLAAIIVVLVYQVSNQKIPAPKVQSANGSSYVSLGDTVASEKRSLGPKSYIMPKPALVIGSYGNDGTPNIMTAAWAGIVNSDPLSVGVSIRASRKSYENIMATKAFTINVPSASYVAEMDYVGTVSGYDEDKFKKLGLTAVKGSHVDAPYIGEFPLVIECEVTEAIDLGSHTQFIGRIIDTKVDEHLIKQNGHIDIEQMQPVIFSHEYYYGYGQRLAKPSDIYKVFKDDMEPDMPATRYANSTLSSIYNRKSVRHYTSRVVSKGQLNELLRAGMAAPTAMDKRPWAFVVVQERALLDSLAAALPYGKMLYQATAAIVVCGDLNKTLDGEVQQYWIQDCSAATQNILLAAESMGLGAVWTGVYPRQARIETVTGLLNIPESAIPLNVIAVGYPTGEDQPKDKWDETTIHWEKW
ncbi:MULTISPECIES: flavin reductase [unclassified Carboxylicivirga]|uniref:flavin reductase n=1 Tax=Carboxylicivirga TaxID=1628153 RepID=UPI003D32B556